MIPNVVQRDLNPDVFSAYFTRANMPFTVIAGKSRSEIIEKPVTFAAMAIDLLLK